MASAFPRISAPPTSEELRLRAIAHENGDPHVGAAAGRARRALERLYRQRQERDRG